MKSPTCSSLAWIVLFVALLSGHSLASVLGGGGASGVLENGSSASPPLEELKAQPELGKSEFLEATEDLATEAIRIQTKLVAPIVRLGSKLSAPIVHIKSKLAAPLAFIGSALTRPIVQAKAELAAPSLRLGQIASQEIEADRFFNKLGDALSPLNEATEPLQEATRPLVDAVEFGLGGFSLEEEIARSSDLDEDVRRLKEAGRRLVNETQRLGTAALQLILPEKSKAALEEHVNQAIMANENLLKNAGQAISASVTTVAQDIENATTSTEQPQDSTSEETGTNEGDSPPTDTSNAVPVDEMGADNRVPRSIVEKIVLSKVKNFLKVRLLFVAATYKVAKDASGIFLDQATNSTSDAILDNVIRMASLDDKFYGALWKTRAELLARQRALKNQILNVLEREQELLASGVPNFLAVGIAVDMVVAEDQIGPLSPRIPRHHAGASVGIGDRGTRETHDNGESEQFPEASSLIPEPDNTCLAALVGMETSECHREETYKTRVCSSDPDCSRKVPPIEDIARRCHITARGEHCSRSCFEYRPRNEDSCLECRTTFTRIFSRFGPCANIVNCVLDRAICKKTSSL